MKRIHFFLSSVTAAILTVGGLFAAAHPPVAQAQTVQKDYVNHPEKANIEYAVKNNLMWLYPDGNFRPGQPVTQADVVAGLVNVKGLTVGAPVQGFPANHWAKVYYERASKDGILNGVVINPSKVLTREEVAKLIVNAWQNVRASVTQKNSEYRKNDSYVQFVVGYRQMKPKAGKFPNGVETSLYDSFGSLTRAELAYTLTFLKKDFLEVREAEAIADKMHNSIKISGGYIIVTAPTTRKELEAKFLIVTKSGNSLDTLKKGSLKYPIADIHGMLVSVRNKESNTALVDYRYSKLPKLDRERIWW
jgi:hypothetical protein